MFGVIAILGRGIRRLEPLGPCWVLTEDLEVYDDNGAHLRARVPADDENPNCLVGGGELNLHAGLALYQLEGSRIVVCAYGNRSAYLREAEAPLESVVMSKIFKDRAPLTQTSVWSEDDPTRFPSNSDRELQNIFEFAVSSRDFSRVRVAVLTVAVHLPRVMLFSKKHLEAPEFENLRVSFFSAEQVFLETNPMLAPRILALWSSKAFQRTAERELRGVRNFEAGNYRAIIDRVPSK